MRWMYVFFVLSAVGFASLYNVDQPVPVSLVHGEYYAGVRLWGNGGALVRFGIGLFDRLTLGASFGGDSLIGAHKPALQRRPEFIARGAILIEQGFYPDLVVGFESQGLGSQQGDEYEVLPKGGYVCVGKTIEPTQTYVELGVNYWEKVNGFVAVNQFLPGAFEFVVEYDLAANDDRLQSRRGFLNVGLGWTFGEQLRFGLAVRDVLGSRDETRLNRVLDLSFRDLF